MSQPFTASTLTVTVVPAAQAPPALYVTLIGLTILSDGAAEVAAPSIAE